jgi:enoyl-CoA hydratase/carnithine racemase
VGNLKEEGMISPSERVLDQIEGGVGWIVFNNPERLNAISLDMWEALAVIVEHYERDPAVRAIVLKGAGNKAFVAGADISQFEKQRSSAESIAHYDATSARGMQKLTDVSKPTLAMIHGYCLGGGVGIAIACDIRIASETARFGIPAARLGVGYGWPGVKKLVDLVNPAVAKEIFFTARQFSAAEAQAMGLINRVVPEGELENYVRSYCGMIAENAPLTMAAIKVAVREIAKPSAEIDRARCDELVTRCFTSQDYIEGRRAFMEKRKPVFTGK